MSKAIQANIIPDFSDKLYRNDGLKFTDVTAEAGITNKTWGHSASINDYNQDGWLDLYVSNDFLEPDHLWINDQNGGFKDEILTTFDHISYYSMGSDVADINNDGMEDLIVLDMAQFQLIRGSTLFPARPWKFSLPAAKPPSRVKQYAKRYAKTATLPLGKRGKTAKAARALQLQNL